MSLPGDVEYADFHCSTENEINGQWIIYDPSRRDARLLAIYNGRRVENIGGMLVFTSRLDEAGEEFLVVLRTGGVLVVRIYLSSEKLSLTDYHSLVGHYITLLGYPRSGARSIAGRESDSGRLPNDAEIIHRVIGRAANLLMLAGQVKSDLPRHGRCAGGTSGIDAAETLAAWKRHPDWYRPANSGSDLVLQIDPFHGVVPLRTVPRVARSANAFIGACIVYLREIIGLMPRTAGSLIAVALLRASGKLIEVLEPSAPFTPKQARSYLANTDLPSRSRAFVDELDRLYGALVAPGLHAPEEVGREPFFLVPAELIFQRVAILEVLLGLGLSSALPSSILVELASAQGVEFQDYIAWADTASHGLEGWRDGTAMPSGYRPDLVVRRKSDHATLLLDAKLRQGQSADGLLSASGVKDIQAYMQEYRLHNAAMIVPDSSGRGVRREDVKTADFWIRAISLPAWDFTRQRTELIGAIHDLWNNIGV